MARYVSCEGGLPPRNVDFDQRTAFDNDPDAPTAIVQGLLVHPARQKHLHGVHAGAVAEPILGQRRQSRITVTLLSPEQKFAYYPMKPDHPDVGIVFSRREIRACGTQRTAPAARCLMRTVLHEKTTVNLSGLPPRLPNAHPEIPFHLREPSTHRLMILTNAEGGLRSTTLRTNYRELLEERLAQDAETQKSAGESATPDAPDWSDTDEAPLPSPALSSALLEI